MPFRTYYTKDKKAAASLYYLLPIEIAISPFQTTIKQGSLTGDIRELTRKAGILENESFFLMSLTQYGDIASVSLKIW